MKKTILLLMIVVSLGSLKAQESSEGGSAGGLYIGAKAGYGISKYESIIKDEKNFAQMTFDNISLGVLAGYKLNGQISFQLEGNYAQYGARDIIPTYVYSSSSPLLADYGTSSTVHSVDMNIFNIDIPVTARYSFMNDRSFSPYIYAGVNYGINVSAQASIIREITYNDAINYRTTKDDITARIIQNEFAPIAGCGIKMDMLKFSLFGDVRYKYGFTNLSNVDNSFGFTNSALWISAGFYIFL